MPKPSTTGTPDAGATSPAEAIRPSQTESVARRRTFSPVEKLRIVRLADACTKVGEVEALLRREGIYSSHLSHWRKALREGGEQGLTGRKTGRPSKKNAQDRRIEQLERRNARLEREVEISRKLLELQKKASELLGLTLATAPEDEP
jgi:transposase